MSKNVVIIGSNGALGASFVENFKDREGYKLLAVSRGKSKINKRYKNTEVVDGIDLLKNEDLKKLAVKIDQCFDSKFHIINTVGKYYKNGHQPMLSVSAAEAYEIMMSNYMTVYNVVKSIMPLQIERGGGHIVGFSCTSVSYMYPNMAAFAASKSALETLMGVIANEYYKDGIIANTFRLSTLNTEEEKRLKPYGDCDNWLSVNEVAEYVERFISADNNIVSGNNIHIYKYSDSFFGKSFNDRIKTKQ